MKLKLGELSDLQVRLQQSPAHRFWGARILAQRSARMLADYSDLRGQRRYSAAVDFLVNDLFGPDSLCYRELGLQKAEPTMLRVLPEALLGTIAQAIEFSLLTLRLDLQLSEILQSMPGAAVEPDSGSLPQAMRITAAYSEYSRQIALVLRIGAEIETVVHKPFISTALKMCRRPAWLMGLGELQDYLERGVSAFSSMQGSAEFFRIFSEREQKYLDAVFAFPGSRQSGAFSPP